MTGPSALAIVLLVLLPCVFSFSQEQSHQAALNIQWQHGGAEPAKQLLSRDDVELLMSVNTAYEPGRNGTSMNLFENLMALIDQVLEMRRSRLTRYDDETGRPLPYHNQQEADDDQDDDDVSTARETQAEMDDYDVQPELDGDEAYGAFRAILSDDVRYVHQPHMERRGVSSAVEGLVDDAEAQFMARPDNVVSVDYEIMDVRRQGVHVVRMVEIVRCNTIPGLTTIHHTLNVYFVHVREWHAPQPSSIPVHTDADATATTSAPQIEWRIHLIERLPQVINPIKI